MLIRSLVFEITLGFVRQDAASERHHSRDTIVGGKLLDTFDKDDYETDINIYISSWREHRFWAKSKFRLAKLTFNSFNKK